MVTLGETDTEWGWGVVYRNSLHCLYHFSVKLKLYENEKLFLKQNKKIPGRSPGLHTGSDMYQLV